MHNAPPKTPPAGVAVEAVSTTDANATASHLDNSNSPLLPTITSPSSQSIGSTSPSSFAAAMHHAGVMETGQKLHSTAVSNITAVDASSYLLLLRPSRQSMSISNPCSRFVASQRPVAHSQILIAAVGTPATIRETNHRCQVMTARSRKNRRTLLARLDFDGAYWGFMCLRRSGGAATVDLQIRRSGGADGQTEFRVSHCPARSAKPSRSINSDGDQQRNLRRDPFFPHNRCFSSGYAILSIHFEKAQRIISRHACTRTRLPHVRAQRQQIATEDPASMHRALHDAPVLHSSTASVP